MVRRILRIFEVIGAKQCYGNIKWIRIMNNLAETIYNTKFDQNMC